jgi:methylglutaconyl-CoA hydratase
MNETPVLLVESLDDVTALITLNRPERRNALTIELMEALCAALELLAADPQRRLVLVRGAGAGFCSGLDLHETADADVAEHSADWVARTFKTLKYSPLVTVAVAHGAAYAGGAGLLACCDFAVASDDLQVGFPEVRRGLIPALVAAVLEDRLRDGDLYELFLIGEPISAERARTMGLVHRIVPPDQLLDEARTLAATILKGGPEAIRQTKRWLHELRATDRSQVLTQALKVHKRVRESEEAQEGLDAFLEHRDPDWSGST